MCRAFKCFTHIISFNSHSEHLWHRYSSLHLLTGQTMFLKEFRQHHQGCPAKRWWSKNVNPGPGEYKMLPRLVLISRQLWGQVSRAWECRKQHIDGVSMSSDFLAKRYNSESTWYLCGDGVSLPSGWSKVSIAHNLDSLASAPSVVCSHHQCKRHCPSQHLFTLGVQRRLRNLKYYIAR